MNGIIYCIAAFLFVFSLGCDDETNNNAEFIGLANSMAIGSMSRLQTRTVSVPMFTHTPVYIYDQVVFTSSNDDYYVDLPPASESTVGKVFYIYNLSSNLMEVQKNAATSDTITGVVTSATSQAGTCIMVIGNTATSWVAVRLYN